MTEQDRVCERDASRDGQRDSGGDRMICSVCGFTAPAPARQTGAGRQVCDRCWSLPYLWMPDRPDCVAFTRAANAALAHLAQWGISDLRPGALVNNLEGR